MGRRSRARAERVPGEPTAAAPASRWERARNRPKRSAARGGAGAVLGGPPISMTCECGLKHDLEYGEPGPASRCGRRWDTNQIPREHYEVVRRTQLRFRVLPVVFGLLVLGFAVFFTLTGNLFSVFLLLPVGLSVWFVFLRPLHRRRYRARDRRAAEVGAAPGVAARRRLRRPARREDADERVHDGRVELRSGAGAALLERGADGHRAR